MNGGKILSMDVPKLNMKFRDSLNYNPQSLAKWPATFGLRDVFKGQFPHRFNRPENWRNGSGFPLPEDYGCESMRLKDRISFMEWYEEEKKSKNETFDFWTEFVDYCKMDVTVLRKCCMLFRTLFMEISGGMCPFVNATTIAGLCNRFWRSKILEPNQIALLPSVALNRHQSAKALKWLEYRSWEDDVHIQHRNSPGGEVRIGSYYVDGFAATIGRIYEFHGCFFHGCPECFSKDAIHPYRKVAMGQIYDETVRRERYLEGKGNEVVTIWEHEFERLLKVDTDFRQFCSGLCNNDPLNPREAFYGGRTNAFKLHHKVAEGERIKYFDVCSEYPFVNKYKSYPIGHPHIIRKDFKGPDQYFGIVKCRVLPPTDLVLPVLPYRSNGKLTFPLCRVCVENQQNAVCEHCDGERAITGIWCTPELVLALESGYTLMDTFEVWHFPDKEDRLFEKYVDKFLKLKTEASGWPKAVMTDAEKDGYVADYMQREGVDLDPSNIKENPAMRALAKLCLNRLVACTTGRLKDDKRQVLFLF